MFNVARLSNRCEADAVAQFDRTDFGLNIDMPQIDPTVRMAIHIDVVQVDQE